MPFGRKKLVLIGEILVQQLLDQTDLLLCPCLKVPGVPHNLHLVWELVQFLIDPVSRHVGVTLSLF